VSDKLFCVTCGLSEDSREARNCQYHSHGCNLWMPGEWFYHGGAPVAPEQRLTPQPGAETASPAVDPSQRQEGGSHYTKCPIQPFAYSMANGLDPLQHTVVKYTTRFRDKGGIEDLRKAIHCLELLIAWEEQREGAFGLSTRT